MVQLGAQEAFEMMIVWDGHIAVCEETEFEEPILIYGKGTAFNVYQILMDDTLPVNYRAIREDEFSETAADFGEEESSAQINQLHTRRKNKIFWNEHLFKPKEFP